MNRMSISVCACYKWVDEGPILRADLVLVLIKILHLPAKVIWRRMAMARGCSGMLRLSSEANSNCKGAIDCLIDKTISEISIAI